MFYRIHFDYFKVYKVCPLILDFEEPESKKDIPFLPDCNVSSNVLASKLIVKNMDPFFNTKVFN